MSLFGLPEILFVVGDEDVFFFKLQPDTIFEGDIAVEDNVLTGLTPTGGSPVTTTMSWQGNQPQATPKTGKIQAPATVAQIILPLTISIGPTASDRANVKLRASNTVDTADGTVVFDFGLVIGGSPETIPRSVLIPASKFLTIETTHNLGSPVVTATAPLIIERGANTKGIDPLLQ